jgi:hypothetical protein
MAGGSRRAAQAPGATQAKTADTVAESLSPPQTSSQLESYIASAISFATILLRIALGCGILALADSYRRDGHSVTDTTVGAVGIITLAAVIFL